MNDFKGLFEVMETTEATACQEMGASSGAFASSSCSCASK
ncbi:thiopeptide-type bacteriocin [Pseudoalteromonas luteoviolacea]|nr:thiopeptide-type bacteriocin [Pseudoalteromonas luteoviolacea]